MGVGDQGQAPAALSLELPGTHYIGKKKYTISGNVRKTCWLR